MENASTPQESALDDLVSLWQRLHAEGRETSPTALCRDCPELLPDLQRRLAVLKQMSVLAGSMLQTTTLDMPDAAPAPLSNNDAWPEIPGYEIVGELGRGGMGIVYKARQQGLNRLAALKMILHANYAGPEQRRRFQAEAEAIARLQHPHIVQIHEVGEHGGLPYFSLEFCSGGSLADKLDGTPLLPDKAALLVEQLAQAIHAAHRAGVIHRDLKPANVLLTEDGSPRITDFGLAKKLDDDQMRTASGAILGTPCYMAPEQALGQVRTIGPTTDVYALGAILYELLTGRPPFKGTTAADTILQAASDEPVPPRYLQPSVPRDLETICLKCLQKQATRRYDSALAMADDLIRFRLGEPIRARPIGIAERLLRWARRSPRVAALSAAVVLLVFLLLTGSFLATARIAQSRDDERRQRENALELARSYEQLAEKERLTADSAKNAASLLANLFEASDPVGILSGTPSSRRSPDERRALRDMLDSAHRDIRPKFTRQPALLALLLDSIGNAYRGLGLYDRAEPLLREALTLRRGRAEEAPLDLAESLHHLAGWHHEKGDYEAAEKLYQEALDLRVRALRTEEHLLVSASKFALAWLLTEAGESEKPERLFREAIETRRRLQGSGRREVAIAQVGLAAFFIDRQRHAEALPLVLEAAKVLIPQGEFGKLGEAVLQFQVAVRSREAGWAALAESAFRRSLELTRQALGERHIYVALILHELGDAQEKRGNLVAAEKTYRECLEVARSQVGLTHPKSVYPIASLARVLAKKGRRPEAEQLFTELRQANENRYGKQNVRVAVTLTAYAAFLDDRGDTSRSAQVRQEADDLFRGVQSTGHRIFALNLSSWADSCWALGRRKQAEQLAREALPLVERHFGRDSLTAVNLLAILTLALIDEKRYAEAEPFCKRALELIQRRPSARWGVLDMAGRLYRGLERFEEAEKFYRDALALARKERVNRPKDLAYSLKNLAAVLAQRGKQDEAAPLFAEAERLRNQHKKVQKQE